MMQAHTRLNNFIEYGIVPERVVPDTILDAPVADAIRDEAMRTRRNGSVEAHPRASRSGEKGRTGQGFLDPGQPFCVAELRPEII